jgi:hypothetical protein
VNGVFLAEAAVFLELHPVGMLALVLVPVVIAALAVGAGQGYQLSHFIYIRLVFARFWYGAIR